MSDVFGLILSAVCGGVLTLGVIAILGLIHEHREFAEEQRRNDEWDREHGIGHKA